MPEEINEIDASKESQFDIHKMTTIFFNSYKHSQGENYTQILIFQYIHTIRPNWKISEKQRDFVRSMLFVPLLKYTNSADADNSSKKSPHSVRDPNMVQLEYKSTLETFCAILNGESHSAWSGDKGQSKLVRQIAKEMLNSDIKYLHSGRPNRKTTEEEYFSFIDHFAIKRHTTGIVEYDNLYAEIRREIEKEDPVLSERLNELNSLRIHKLSTN